MGAEGLGKRYGPRWLFRDLRFTLERGDSLIVAGENGSGKSTLLKLLAGLVSPSEGTISLPTGDARTSLGYSALDLNVYPHLTAIEHLLLASRLRGCEPQVQPLLERVSLTRAANQRIGEFSTGMRARLKLAIAIQAAPKALLLDEPSASLDQAGRELAEEIIKDQRERGACVIATNDKAEWRLGTHVLELA